MTTRTTLLKLMETDPNRGVRNLELLEKKVVTTEEIQTMLTADLRTEVRAVLCLDHQVMAVTE